MENLIPRNTMENTVSGGSGRIMMAKLGFVAEIGVCRAIRLAQGGDERPLIGKDTPVSTTEHIL